jgi:uncharacterized surface protein with fasciclin (FAS1) repeats
MTFLRLAAATCAAVLVAAPALAQPAAPAPAPATQPAPTGDVLDTLKARGNFTTFLKLIDAAELGPTLKGLPSITMFAPTDAAFAALAPGVVDGWMAPDHKEGLQRLLLYHVINAKLTAAQIAGHKSPVATGAGSSVVLDGSAADGKIMVDAATVTQADVAATNGNIFIIDKVLAPR